MRIGDKNYLLIEKRGCNFFAGDESVKGSDVGNYRVFIRFIDKSGREVCGDVARFRGGDTLSTQMCHYDSTGNCLGFWHDPLDPLPFDVSDTYPYTLAGILRYVNERSGEHYNDVKWVESFSFEQEPGANFVPGDKIAEWAQREHLESWYEAGDIRVRTYTGVWKYLKYDTHPVRGRFHTFERVTIYMELGKEA